MNKRERERERDKGKGERLKEEGNRERNKRGERTQERTIWTDVFCPFFKDTHLSGKWVSDPDSVS